MSAPDLRFRDAGPGDSPAIAGLHAASWRVAYRGILPDAVLDGPLDDDRRRHWARLMAGRQGDDIIHLAEDGAGLAGFIAVWAAAEPGFDALVDNLHARPDRRGGGIGRRLMGIAAARLAATGSRSLCLWILDGNHPAQRFYERLGGALGRSEPTTVAGATVGHTLMAWHDLPALAAACRG